MARILVLGGYGVFGGRAAERLARHPGLDVLVAGRDLARARDKASVITSARSGGAGSRPGVEGVLLDAMRIEPADIRRLGASIVVNAVGPFQGQDYRVARASVAAGAHYVDLADARAFVGGVSALDAEARAAGVLVVSGASSVPALAAAVLDEVVSRMPQLETVDCLISPGNSFDPGPATTAAILGGLGRPHAELADGRRRVVHGWQPLQARRIPGVGTRLVGACDVPDLDLFPERYPGLRTQRFNAGVEVVAFHLGLYAVSWLVRAGLLRNPERLAGPLLQLKRRLGFLGTDVGTMRMEASGNDAAGRRLQLAWTLVGRRGHGPYIPATPAVIVASKLARGEIGLRGARPCLDLFTLAEFTAEVADLAIEQTWDSPVTVGAAV
jgi:saccharopine dehydrogenase-like NADP-dependent oxidoreductase